MKIHPLLEGIYNVSKQKEFTYLTNDILPKEGVNMNVCPFLIETDDDLILIDCGFGAINNNKTYLISKLNSYGFSENDISIILISHLHKDHINGLGRVSNDKFECYFPNAQIYIQQREMNFALEQETFNYEIDFLNLIKDYPNIVYLNTDKGKISDVISYEVVGGHVPFQQVFWIEEDCEIAFFGADNLPQLNYLKYQAAFKNDIDGVKAMNDRIEWQKKAQSENWTILFYHGKKTFMKTF
jgi:glyoxylase-like metal-dependent hydrolase (beta-lactamase superfamily II)